MKFNESEVADSVTADWWERGRRTRRQLRGCGAPRSVGSWRRGKEMMGVARDAWRLGVGYVCCDETISNANHYLVYFIHCFISFGVLMFD